MALKWQKFVKAFITNGGYETVLSGLGTTAEIAIFGFLIGIVIGTLIAVVKLGGTRNKLLSIIGKIGDVYVTFFRGTPIIVQLLVIYYILFPSIGVRVDKNVVAIVTFGMNSGAYVGEIIRGGIQSVDVGQLEAGRAVGMSYTSTMMKVVLPQAVKNSLPSLGNELIALVKDTSVVSIISVVDLTIAFKSLASGSREYVVPYLMLALTYLVIVLILTFLIKLLERRLSKSDRR